MKAYIDSSFLVSLYSLDANSQIAAADMQSSPAAHVISTLCELEVFNAFELRVFRKEATTSQAKQSAKAFTSDIRDGVFQLATLTDSALAKARQLSRQYSARLGTRTADVLHVAAALELRVDTLLSFDRHQRGLAKALGLKLNPS